MQKALCLCRAWWDGSWDQPLLGVLHLEGGKKAFEFPAQGWIRSEGNRSVDVCICRPSPVDVLYAFERGRVVHSPLARLQFKRDHLL